MPYLVVERDRAALRRTAGAGRPGVFGDASVPGVLEQAGVATARLLVVATPDSFIARRAVEIAREHNPSVEIVVRTHSHEELSRLRAEHSGRIIMASRSWRGNAALHAASLRCAADSSAGCWSRTRRAPSSRCGRSDGSGSHGCGDGSPTDGHGSPQRNQSRIWSGYGNRHPRQLPCSCRRINHLPTAMVRV